MLTLGLFGCGEPPQTTPEEVFSSQNEEAVYGLTMLASGHKEFPCEKMFTFYDAAPSIYHGTLWQTFGSNRLCWQRLFNDEKRVHLQFYLSNEVCRKKGNCAPYEFFPSLSVEEYNRALESSDPSVLEELREALAEILKFCEEEKKELDECLIAFGLEDQFTPEALLVLTKLAIQTGWQYEQIVHNPLGNRDVGSSYALERHGRVLGETTLPPARLYHTFDGLYSDLCSGEGPNIDPISEQELQLIGDYYRDKARFVGFWCPEWQGLTTDSAAAPLPRARFPHIDSHTLDSFRKLAGYIL